MKCSAHVKIKVYDTTPDCKFTAEFRKLKRHRKLYTRQKGSKKYGKIRVAFPCVCPSFCIILKIFTAAVYIRSETQFMSKTGSHGGIHLVRPIKLSILCQHLECLPILKAVCLIYQIHIRMSSVCPKMTKVQQSLSPTAKLEKLVNLFCKGFSIQMETVDPVCGFRNVQLPN